MNTITAADARAVFGGNILVGQYVVYWMRVNRLTKTPASADSHYSLEHAKNAGMRIFEEVNEDGSFVNERSGTLVFEKVVE